MTSGATSAGAALEAMATQFQDLVRNMVEGSDALGLEAVLDYARRALGTCDHAAITIARRGREPETALATGDLPRAVDALQFTIGEGPGVAALTQSDLVVVTDFRTDDQFPRFAPAALDLGVRSMLSSRLFLSEHDRAALTFYSERADAFDPEHLPVAAIFASYVSLLLINQLHEDRVMQLERALESNREIGIAMGILMAQKRWSQTEAFDRLVGASQHLNRRLHDIATEVKSTHRLPLTRPRGRSE